MLDPVVPCWYPRFHARYANAITTEISKAATPSVELPVPQKSPRLYPEVSVTHTVSCVAASMP